MSEKRKFMRFAVLLDAIFRGGVSGSAKVNNFSRHGLGIITEEDLETGEEFELELSIPGDNIPVICQGEIAWKKRYDADQAKNKCGFLIKDIDSKDRGRLLEHVYKKWIVSSERNQENRRMENHV